MMTAAIFAGIGVVLFFASLVSKRRFGVLGLALAAGFVLSGIWDKTAGLLISLASFIPEGTWNEAVAKSLIILAPAGILLFHGVTYKTMAARIFGSLLFTGLALTFLMSSLVSVLPSDGLSKQVIDWFQSNRSLLISFGLIVAVFDLFLTKSAKAHDDKKGKR